MSFNYILWYRKGLVNPKLFFEHFRIGKRLASFQNCWQQQQTLLKSIQSFSSVVIWISCRVTLWIFYTLDCGTNFRWKHQVHQKLKLYNQKSSFIVCKGRTSAYKWKILNVLLAMLEACRSINKLLMNLTNSTVHQ